MAVRDFLDNKGQPVVTAPTGISVKKAIRLMTHEKVEALIVEHEGRPVGIFSTRDCFRLFLDSQPEVFEGLTLGSVMTDKLIFADPDDEIDTVTAMMIRTDISHLPVIENGRLCGMLKANDLYMERIQILEDELHRLRNYIEDLHQAGLD